jgi:hypothetical protein
VEALSAGLWEGMNGLPGEGQAAAETFADRGAGLGACRRWFPGGDDRPRSGFIGSERAPVDVRETTFAVQR